MDEYELEEIKREIVEGRSLSIKTNNLVNALAADLKSISKRQQGSERRAVFSTATAYVVTTLVILVAVKLAWDLKIDAVRAETKDTRDAVTQMDKELKGAQAREEKATRAGRLALDFYRLIEQRNYKEIIDGYSDVSALALTATERLVFQNAAEQAKNQLSLQAYQAGLEHAQNQRWHETEEAMLESLRYKDNAAHSPSATYQLALARTQLGHHRDAITSLIELSESSPDREILDDATLLLANTQLQIEAYNDAKTTLRSFIRRFPNSPFLNDVKAKLADVQLRH
ncbi:MAG: hypothetical protein SFV15_02360 [Polyangiaceae bacterium]|nr:hypothetical protein [Polyangiaceae bacterium]